MASVNNIIRTYSEGENIPANDNGWGMVLRTNGVETRLSPVLTGWVLENVRTLQHDRLWLSEEGQDCIDNLTVLLDDHL